MNVLVTGGAGFVASAIVRLLVGEGRGNVINVDKLTYAADLSRLSSVRDNPCYHFIEADVCDQKRMLEIMQEHQINAIIHAAAETHVDRSIDSPEPFLRSNVIGTYTLLEATREYLGSLSEQSRASFRFVQISTDEVFGDREGLGKATEDCAYRPSSPYAASKASADHHVRSWARTYDLPILITHGCNNYGPGQHEEKLIPKVIANALEHKSIPVYGDGQQVRDWIHIDDNAQAVLTILDKGTLGESYNISAACEIANLDLIQQICSLLGEYLDVNRPNDNIDFTQFIEHVEDRAGHDVRYAINANKLMKLGWQPKVSLSEGLRDTIVHHCHN